MRDFYQEPVPGGVSERLWKENQDLARMSLHHPFVQGLGDGTLDSAAFQTYMAQDTLYLNGYIRTLSYCIAKSDVTATGGDLLALLDGVGDELKACHQHYIDNPDATGPEAACRKYVDFLLAIGQAADLGPSVVIAAVIPCARLYAWIGKELTMGKEISEDHPFRRWLLSYSDEPINTSAKILESLLDKQIRPGEFGEVAQAYRRAMELEYDFFDSFGGCLGRPSEGTMKIPTVLIVSGSDSGGGAGHQADLKTLEALGVYSTSALTSITAQNTKGVQQIQVVNEDIFAAQMNSVTSDFEVSVVKLGLVPTARQLEIVGEKLAELPMVVDPVLVATSGDDLVAQKNAEDVLAMYKERIFPRATIITPNVVEAERILGRKEISGVYEARAAAQALAQYGSKYVLLKGGHDETDPKACRDVLYDREKDEFYEFTNRRIATINTHGTGCTLASAISAFMARGYPVPVAVERAIGYLHEVIVRSCGVPLGQGTNRPLVHSANSVWANYV
ncbi:phosphomethylpyrimidine kinase, putative [Perkinsus marinus ATCC 50983]|uniref:Phosphomethylpyrimidine kinase, putative n=1 Tax=Perkinsus marinus (strain ATCC 50983 / TXsc) TaxID=423536 RepID=C5LCI6_PERM5|nr:phosphomethylpyrimidine kinase, putative [Perkinsus marinus ATCC 50983]EER05669.1 phosphomethylpyrimidine kinase, putative [Perkinsus marinus ATCC 50983]|eukprot:XP_002773853.1 phosphomethylpyrimidine kinase, putative [Perkinsus marinus ATCC 50983]